MNSEVRGMKVGARRWDANLDKEGDFHESQSNDSRDCLQKYSVTIVQNIITTHNCMRLCGWTYVCLGNY